jgi:hypothetical protein
MKSYVDGYEVWSWPEFRVFAELVGIEPVGLVTLEVFIPCDGYAVINCNPPQATIVWDGIRLYNSPEFKALALRLGVCWELPTRNISFRLAEGESTEIQHSYLARETLPDDPVPDVVALLP